jgi:hypothetical protein
MFKFLSLVIKTIKTLVYDVYHPDTVKNKCFCRKWAELSSMKYEFHERRETIWKLPWRVEFYDLHKWAGSYSHWNSHDVEPGEGKTLDEAWRNMAGMIMEYEHAASKEEALLKAEFALRRIRPYGWGNTEYRAFYRL